MADYLRVQWKATGHESSLPAHRFDPSKHAKTGKDAVDRDGKPLPPKYRTALDGKSKPRATPSIPTPVPAPDENGQQADPKKES